MGLTNTPRGNQLHIGIFGKRNSGKSSLINAITNQGIALVSQIPGTTTDPVYKTMEISGIGPCVFIDTAGFDDEGELGENRIRKTKEVLEKTDFGIIVCASLDLTKEVAWAKELKKRDIPFIIALNKIDVLEDIQEIEKIIVKTLDQSPILISAKEKINMDQLREGIIRKLPVDYQEESIVGHLVNPLDVVLLVMPQDIQAPKGRLILPQVQTIRDILDHKGIPICCTTEEVGKTLGKLKEPPKLIITDSQVFPIVFSQKPKESLLTSFSVLFAHYKGDIHTFIEGAKKIDQLNEESKVLIAEACTHAPLTEDIGRVKIPNLLRRKVGKDLRIDVVSGVDFPEDLREYDLIIHCGSCMFNKKYVMARVERAKQQAVPITNYGIVIAFLGKILENIVF